MVEQVLPPVVGLMYIFQKRLKCTGKINGHEPREKYQKHCK